MKACDAVGGAFRPKWREGSLGEEEVSLKEKTSPSSWEANGGDVTNVWNTGENWIYWTGDNLPDGLIFLSIVPQSASRKLKFSIADDPLYAPSSIAQLPRICTSMGSRSKLRAGGA
jgi:hypothetical protein